jgi:hypothetical protein
MGASLTKQTSIVETVNNIVNKTVNKTINSNKATAMAVQNMELGCTDAQFALASKSYDNAQVLYTKNYTKWLETGAKTAAMPTEPKYVMCSFDDITQNAVVTLKTDSKTKNEMKNNIKTDLKAEASQYDSLDKVKDLVGYSDTDKEAIVKIANNVINETYNETLNETINIATANQDLKLTGGKFSNVKQSAVVDMVTYSIVANITEGISDTVLTSTTEQKSSMKEESGQANTIKAVTDMVGSVVNNAISMVGSVWLLMIIGVFCAIVFFPGIFCMFPPLRIPLMVIGLCSSKKDADKDTSADYDNDNDNNNRPKSNNRRNNDDDNDNQRKSNNRRNNDE